MTKRRLTVAEASARGYPDRFEARAAVRRMLEILAWLEFVRTALSQSSGLE